MFPGARELGALERGTEFKNIDMFAGLRLPG